MVLEYHTAAQFQKYDYTWELQRNELRNTRSSREMVCWEYTVRELPGDSLLADLVHSLDII